MFTPEEQVLIDKIEVLLSDYDLEELLNDNDLTVAEAVLLLFISGHIEFPDWSDVL